MSLRSASDESLGSSIHLNNRLSSQALNNDEDCDNMPETTPI